MSPIIVTSPTQCGRNQRKLRPTLARQRQLQSTFNIVLPNDVLQVIFSYLKSSKSREICKYFASEIFYNPAKDVYTYLDAINVKPGLLALRWYKTQIQKQKQKYTLQNSNECNEIKFKPIRRQCDGTTLKNRQCMLLGLPADRRGYYLCCKHRNQSLNHLPLKLSPPLLNISC